MGILIPPQRGRVGEYFANDISRIAEARDMKFYMLQRAAALTKNMQK